MEANFTHCTRRHRVKDDLAEDIDMRCLRIFTTDKNAFYSTREISLSIVLDPTTGDNIVP